LPSASRSESEATSAWADLLILSKNETSKKPRTLTPFDWWIDRPVRPAVRPASRDLAQAYNKYKLCVLQPQNLYSSLLIKKLARFRQKEKIWILKLKNELIFGGFHPSPEVRGKKKEVIFFPYFYIMVFSV
jgi:hypothetical protein